MRRKSRPGCRPVEPESPVESENFEPDSPVKPQGQDELPAELEADILDELAWCEPDDDHEAEPEPGDFDFERSWDDE